MTTPVNQPPLFPKGSNNSANGNLAKENNNPIPKFNLKNRQVNGALLKTVRYQEDGIDLDLTCNNFDIIIAIFLFVYLFLCLFNYFIIFWLW